MITLRLGSRICIRPMTPTLSSAIGLSTTWRSPELSGLSIPHSTPFALHPHHAYLLRLWQERQSEHYRKNGGHDVGSKERDSTHGLKGSSRRSRGAVSGNPLFHDTSTVYSVPLLETGDPDVSQAVGWSRFCYHPCEERLKVGVQSENIHT
jgi:hypothetical protein